MLRVVLSWWALEAVVVVLAVTTTLWARRRRLRKHDRRPLEGFVQTDETFIDPTTGIRQQVWFNAVTGERRYVTVERPRHG